MSGQGSRPYPQWAGSTNKQTNEQTMHEEKEKQKPNKQTDEKPSKQQTNKSPQLLDWSVGPQAEQANERMIKRANE